MQGLLGAYQWDWTRLRDQLPGLAAAWIPEEPQDLIGPGIAIDETAQLKKGEATACVAPQHAGCTGTVENCVTTVFCAYVTANGQAWVDFDGYMPQRWASDAPRRRAAGIPDELTFATKPQLAMNQLDRQMAAGSPAGWVAFDEVYGRSEPLRNKAAEHGLAYVGIIPCDYQIRLPSGAAIRAEQAAADAVFERRSVGNGSKGPRYSDWAMTATAVAGQYLLIRRLLSRPDSYTFYLCWAPPDRPATMTYFITIAGRRRPVETTFRRARTCSAGTKPRPVPGTGSAGTPPWPPSPNSAPPPSATRSPPASPCQPTPTPTPTTARRTPAPRPATTATATATARSATPTCRSPSATRPYRSAPPNPAHPRSARSNCPSPKPPG